MCKGEAILNDQSNTKVSDDPNDLEPLSTNDSLLLKGKTSLPPGLFQLCTLSNAWVKISQAATLYFFYNQVWPTITGVPFVVKFIGT